MNIFLDTKNVYDKRNNVQIEPEKTDIIDNLILSVQHSNKALLLVRQDGSGMSDGQELPKNTFDEEHIAMIRKIVEKDVDIFNFKIKRKKETLKILEKADFHVYYSDGIKAIKLRHLPDKIYEMAKKYQGLFILKGIID